MCACKLQYQLWQEIILLSEWLYCIACKVVARAGAPGDEVGIDVHNCAVQGSHSKVQLYDLYQHIDELSASEAVQGLQRAEN